MGAVLSYTEPKKVKSKFFDSTVKDLPSMKGKVVVVTGTTTGTGFIFAKTCMRQDATVVALNRPSERVDAATRDLQEQVAGTGQLVNIACNLQSFASVQEAAKQISAQFQANGVDVLCNNAGIMATEDQATEDGCDTQMQTNHLSHFLLTKELWPLLTQAAAAKGESRVVNHSSVARQGKPLEGKYLGKNGGNLGGDKGGVGPFSGPMWDRYHHTKLANLVFTYALRDRAVTAGSKVKVLCAHPGYAHTHLQVKAVAVGSLSAGVQAAAGNVAQSPEDGSLGITLCCCKTDVETGQFYGPTASGGMAGMAVVLPPGPEEALASVASRAMLWEESEKSTGTTFDVN